MITTEKKSVSQAFWKGFKYKHEKSQLNSNYYLAGSDIYYT